MQGVGIANIVSNREEVVGWGETKKIKSVITFNDGMYTHTTRMPLIMVTGSTWQPLQPPNHKMNGDDWGCDINDSVRSLDHLSTAAYTSARLLARFMFTL